MQSYPLSKAVDRWGLAGGGGADLTLEEENVSGNVGPLILVGLAGSGCEHQYSFTCNNYYKAQI